MDGTLSNSQLDEDKEEQIKLEILVTEETKGFAPIDHWKKMLSMKTEEVCTINIGTEISNMSAGKPTVVEEVENSGDNSTTPRTLTAVDSFNTKHEVLTPKKAVDDDFNTVSKADDASVLVDIVKVKDNMIDSGPADTNGSPGIKPMGDKPEIVGGNSTNETTQNYDSSVIKSTAEEKEDTDTKPSNLDNLENKLLKGRLSDTKVFYDDDKGIEGCSVPKMKECQSPLPQKAKQAESCEKQTTPKQDLSGKKPPLHRLMINYAELKEQVENEESEKAEGCRKSGRPRKIPDKFVAEPASIFLNPMSAKERKKRRKMLKKELKQQKESEKKTAMEVRLAQKHSALAALEQHAMNGYATELVQPLASSLTPKTKQKNTTRGGTYKTRQFPEQLILLLATKTAPNFLWWIPKSNGRAFAVDCAWFGEKAMQRFFPNSGFGRIVQCLKKWGFRKTTSRKVPDGFSVFEHPLFQRSQPGFVKEIKLGDPKFQKPRRRLAAHPVRPTPKSFREEAQIGTKRHPLQQTHTNYDTGALGAQALSKPIQPHQQKIAFERAPRPPSPEIVDLTVCQPKIAPNIFENIRKKRTAADSFRQGQTLSKCSRIISLQDREPHQDRHSPHGSAKALAAHSIAALAESVRSGRPGGQNTMDIMRADWEMQDRKPAAVSNSVHSRHEPVRHPYESAHAQEGDRLTQDQLKQHAEYYAAAAKQREEARLLKMKTLALQAEIAESQRRVSERKIQEERAQAQRRAMERAQREGMAREQRIIKERQQQRHRRQEERALEQQIQKVGLPEHPVEDSEAARRRRLASALFGSNSVSKTTAKEVSAPKPSLLTDRRGPTKNAPDRRGREQKPQKETIRRTSAPLLAVARPTTSSSRVPQAMATSQTFRGSLPFSNNRANLGSASHQQHFGGPLSALVAGVDPNSAAAFQQFGAHFPVPVTDPMVLLHQQQQQEQQHNLALTGFSQQTMTGLSAGNNNNVDLQQFMMMQQRQFQ